MNFRFRLLASNVLAVAFCLSRGETLQLGWQSQFPVAPKSTYASVAAQDAQENLYVASRQPSPSGDTIWITKCNSYGLPLWRDAFPSSGTSYPDTLTTDPSGHVIFTISRMLQANTGRVDLYDINAATGSTDFTRMYGGPSGINAFACGIEPVNDNIELALAVPGGPGGSPFTRNLRISPTGVLLNSLDDPSVNPSRMLFDNSGNRFVVGSDNNLPLGSEIAREYGASSLVPTWTSTVAGGYVAATRTRTQFYFNEAYDEATGHYYLATTRLVSVNNGPPMAASSVAAYDSFMWHVGTSPTTSTAIFGISANSGVVVTGAGTNGSYQHTVLSGLGNSKIRIMDDQLRDFCVHDGELYFCDGSTSGFAFSAYSSAGVPLINPILFACPVSSYCYGGNLFSQPNSFVVIGSFEQSNGIYAPCVETFRDGPRFSAVDFPPSCVSGTTVPITVHSNGPAPMGGFTINLSGTGLTIGQAVVTIPAGQTSATTSAVVAETGKPIDVTLIAKGSGVLRKDVSTDKAAKMIKAEATQTVVGGNPIPVTITLDGKAPAGGLLITVSSNDTTAVSTGQTITVSEGDTSVTSFVDSKAVTINHTVKLTFKDPSGTTLEQTVTVSK